MLESSLPETPVQGLTARATGNSTEPEPRGIHCSLTGNLENTGPPPQSEPQGLITTGILTATEFLT